jgi:hypothetical protein
MTAASPSVTRLALINGLLRDLAGRLRGNLLSDVEGGLRLVLSR